MSLINLEQLDPYLAPRISIQRLLFRANDVCQEHGRPELGDVDEEW